MSTIHLHPCCRMLALLAVLLLPCSALAQSAEREGLQCERPGSLLWKASGSAGAGELWLFGSIHLGKAEFYPLHGDIESALAASEYLVFEVDPAAMADPSLLLQLQQRGMLPQGETLEDHVSPALVAQLREVLAELGLPADNFLRMQPWLLTLVLSSLQMTQQGYLPQYGIESYLMGRKPPEVEVLELEGMARQMALLESLNGESFLAYSLESFREDREQVETLMQAWRCADNEALSELLFAEFEGSGGTYAEDMERLYELMFVERNRFMAEAIQGYLEQGGGDYFVVVGAGHLLGEDSVIELLEAAGVALENVPLH